MNLGSLKAPVGAKKKRKRVGRGEGSGHGGTSCRGHKGQKARAGGFHKRGFEGGQSPLIRRLPKRGFFNPFSREFEIVNVGDLEGLPNGQTVDPGYLKEKGLIRGDGDLKILGDGELKTALTVKAHAFSVSAKLKIEKAGGKIEALGGTA